MTADNGKLPPGLHLHLVEMIDTKVEDKLCPLGARVSVLEHTKKRIDEESSKTLKLVQDQHGRIGEIYAEVGKMTGALNEVQAELYNFKKGIEPLVEFVKRLQADAEAEKPRRGRRKG